MTWMLLWKMSSGFVVKNWRAMVIGLVLGACLWIWCDWRGQAAEISALEYQLKTELALTRQWRDVARMQSENAKANAEKKAAAEEKLRELLARPPKIITIYEDAAADVADAVPDDVPCEEAVRSLAEFMAGVGGGS